MLAIKFLKKHRIYFFYILPALTVLLPMLTPGYILTLDMVFVPRLEMPATVTSSYLFYVALHLLNWLLSSEVIEKGILFAILLLSGIGMHRLVVGFVKLQPDIVKWVAIAAGTFYMINPFTYSRFMAGQYAVLLGYALLPFFALSFKKFLQLPTLSSMLWLAVWVILISIVSIHTLGLVLVFAILAGLMSLCRRHDKKYLTSLLKFSLLGLAVVAVASSYWLAPLLLGHGYTAESIASFDDSHRQTFATVGQGLVGKLVHIAGLQGFWAEGRELFMLPQDVFRWWGSALLVFWAALVVGIISSWRKDRANSILFITTSLLAAILAIGTTIGGPLGVFNQFLVHHVPFFAGFREPHKFVALVALADGYFLAYGLTVVISFLQKRFRRPLSDYTPQKLVSGPEPRPFRPKTLRRSSTYLRVCLLATERFWFEKYHGSKPKTNFWGVYTVRAVIALAIVLPLLLTPSMVWGFYGQLRPRQYPPDWFAVNSYLKQDKSPSQVLFLPWHMYMSFGFTERIIASPADRFFAHNVIVSDDPEFGGIKPNLPDLQALKIEKEVLPRAGQNDFSSKLAALNVKYILVAKELDYQTYDYLNKQSGIRLLQETKTLKLYQNIEFCDNRKCYE